MARVAESLVPRVIELVVPGLKAFHLLGGSASNDEVDDVVAELIDLSDEAREELHNDGPRTEFSYRMAWVRTYLKNADLLENTGRGVWALTQEGRNRAAHSLDGIADLIKERLAAHTKERAAEPDGESAQADEVGDETDGPDDWKGELLDCLMAMDPAGFERLCQLVLREKGFTRVAVTGQSGDGGIDGNGVLRVNLLSFQVIFQAKRYTGSVGSNVVRDFRGAMVGRADKGLIMTTGTFTRDARTEATRDGAPAIDLVDGDDLCELLKELKIGVSVKLVEEVEIDDSVFATI